jgi:hypothetical protein
MEQRLKIFKQNRRRAAIEERISFNGRNVVWNSAGVLRFSLNGGSGFESKSIGSYLYPVTFPIFWW